MTSAFLDDERQALDGLLPGLDARLVDAPFATLEGRGSPAVGWFRDCGGPALIVPADSSGKGATLVEAVRVQRAIASRSPSLAVATTMHHATVATMRDVEQDGGMEWLLMQAIAEHGLIIASGVAESVPGTGVNTPSLRATRVDGGLRLDGSKKPCSLSASMDLLATSVRVDGDPDGRWAVAIVTADSPGLERRPFWRSDVLAGAESDEVVLRDVFVPERLVTWFGRHGETTDPLRAAFVWFELLISASYLGIASALAERVIRGSATAVTDETVAELVIALEAPMLALLQVAGRVGSDEPTGTMLGPALVARRAVHDGVVRASGLAFEALGGRSFIASSEVAYLYAAARCLQFHPPTAASLAGALADWTTGKPVDVS